MSKIRVYELAKELGIENKDVIAKAEEAGLVGKKSHSSSFEPDEADLVRRAVIRQAIGTEPGVLTKRIDRSTGEAQTVVESRKGNVIRRRKKTEEEEAEAEAAAEAAQEPVEHQNEEPNRDNIFRSKSAQTEEPEDRENIFLNKDEFSEPTIDGNAAQARDVSALAEVSEAEVSGASETADKKTTGPRVLGKMELPVKKVVKVAPKKGTPAFTTAPTYLPELEEDEEAAKKGGKPGDKRKKARKREFNVVDLVDYEGRTGRKLRVPSRMKRSKDDDDRADGDALTGRAIKRVVKMSESITVGEIARQLSVKVGEVIAKLIELGVMATINQSIDMDTATIVAEEFGGEIESTSFDESLYFEKTETEDAVGRVPRPPVVTVMGHVDHGKTSLLDTIRDAAVVDKEHGGITQHIGAYSVTLPDRRKITFIDTPGHEAFTSMRARGAGVTDIVILVVAADDGVMPQTVEAINHAKAAGVPIIVAVNKVDKHGANPDKVKKQLAEHGLQPEDWGGETMFFSVSALKKTGITELLEGILLLAEVKELRANPNRRASGTIIEAKKDPGRGTVATVLVGEGTLRVGDVFVSGAEFGRIRSMVDHLGTRLTEAGPAIPVEITGLDGVPVAGDDFFVVESEPQAREISSNRKEKKMAKERALASGPISLEEFAKRANNVAALELNVILKTDVQGSLEAVRQSLERLSTEKVKVRVVHSAVGGVNESDVQLAVASSAIIIGFGVRSEPRAMIEAEQQGVELRFYRIIYELIDDVKQAMTGLLPALKKEVPLARVEVREIFSIPKIGVIAGSYVLSGTVKRGAFVRLLRDSVVIHEGKMLNLRRFKDDAKEVQSGYECGISIAGYNDIKVGDVIEVYEFEEVAQTL